MTIQAKLYFDPTESRQGTLLPQSLINLGASFPSLEEHTKSDLLITLNQSNPPLIPSLRLDWLKNSCAQGILIQRKTGLDFLNSIPHLTSIITTMFYWSKVSWLSIIGDIQFTDNEMTAMKIDNQWRETNWGKSSVKGALRSWQLSGGLYEIFSTDGEFTKWIKDYLDGGLDELLNETKVIREHTRQVSFAGEHILNSLSLVPSGIGWNKIKLILDQLKIMFGLKEDEYPDVLMVLHIATNKDIQKQIKLKGWGDKSTDAMREHWGLEDGDEINALDRFHFLRCMNRTFLD